MTDAEKEARELVRNLADRFAVAEGYGSVDDTCWPFHDGEWADRILRFAREHGRDLAPPASLREAPPRNPSGSERRGIS